MRPLRRCRPAAWRWMSLMGFVEQGLVLNERHRIEQQLAEKIVFGLESSIPGSQVPSRRAAEHHAVHRDDPRAGKPSRSWPQGEPSGHIEDDAVAHWDAETCFFGHHGASVLDLGQNLRIGELG